MDDSYYKRNKEARKEYQKAYYEAKKDDLRRKRELDAELNPEKQEKTRKYQREYYLTNRQNLLERKKLRYNEAKSA
jgi:hypothetical protein